MKCKFCNQELLPPCAIVEAVAISDKVEANIRFKEKLAAHFAPASQEAIEQWCHEWADDHKCNLHWHWLGKNGGDR